MMRKLLVIGAGTAGVITVNKLRKRLRSSDWEITIVDPADTHDYQPGYLFLAVEIYPAKKVGKPLAKLIPKGVTLVKGAVQDVKPQESTVVLTDGTTLDYDYLVIATGTTPRPDQTQGMGGKLWHESVH